MPLAGRSVRLRSYLATRLRPLTVLLVIVVSVSAPIATWVLGLRTLQLQADTTAREVAESLRREAEERPRLWKYDSLKVLEHVRTYQQRDKLERIEIVDADGVPIDPSFDAAETATLRQAPLLWARAPIMAHGHEVGEVWVAGSWAPVRAGALLLLLPFGALGLALGLLMYWLPLRAMGRAEDHIGGLIARLEQSQAALAALNENLEEQVEERSSQLARAYRELQQKELRLRELSSGAVEIQEAERRAIARDLHDSAGQALTAIRINLQVIGEQLGNEDKSQALVVRTRDMVDDTLEEIRRAVRRLGPAVLDDVGFGEAVTRLCGDIAERSKVRIEVRVRPPRELGAAVEATCYRVVQESLTNVARHAHARWVDVCIEGTAERVHVSVRDDGSGFDPATVGAQSRGLAGMRERVELLGGTLEIDAAPGRGARIAASLPLR